MSLPRGTRLAEYEVLAPLGAGNMGEVYRARDTRIRRDVAVKVLPQEFAADRERLDRFEREARAIGALNHPNLLTLYDVGRGDGRAFLVTELLEGETLRETMIRGPLPAPKVIDYGMQIARGLAAAHEHGIVHRDLKPENLFVTRDGRVKILDFGLARDTTSADGGAFASTLTRSGMIVGTPGYMAPEQVRGGPVDPRADLFALGCVLYEMLSGRRAFRGETAVESMSAALNAEPAALTETGRAIPPGLEAVVGHCLEKRPEARFQSAQDVAFALGALSGISRAPTPKAPVGLPLRLGVGILVLLVALVGAAALGRALRRPAPASFDRLTFRRGTISASRFTPDGRTVVYSAAWDGGPTRLYTTRVDSRESSPLPLPNARLLAVSSAGELAIAVRGAYVFPIGPYSTLARVPLSGGAPREVADNVIEADWSPNGRDLAIARVRGPRAWLEYPIGRVLYESAAAVRCPRVSPKGDRVAFIELESRSDYTRGFVAVADRAGHVKRLTGAWAAVQGLAWSPSGDEIWFTGVERGLAKALRSVSLSGRQRVLLNTPGGITLQDVLPDGRVLVAYENVRLSTVVKPPDSDREQDLSWQESSGAADLSRDGRTLVLTEWGEAFGFDAVVGLRSTDGTPVENLGEGYAGGLSPDGRWVVAIRLKPKPHLSLLPTGVGDVRDLDPGPVTDIAWSDWLPDGRGIAFGGVEPGHRIRAYVQDAGGGRPRPVTPDGIDGIWHGISPDGRRILGASSDSTFGLFPIQGGPRVPIPGLNASDFAIRWCADGRSILVRENGPELPARVMRVDVATGTRQLVRTLMPADSAGVAAMVQVLFTPDERAYAYTITRQLSDLYQVRGVR